jgi:hypothetical protein
MYLACCYNVKPRMMNNILFTKKPNKQKNVYRKCSHILHTHTTESINHGWLHGHSSVSIWGGAVWSSEVTGSYITGYDDTGKDVTGNDVTGNEREIISPRFSPVFPAFFPRYFPRFFPLDSRWVRVARSLVFRWVRVARSLVFSVMFLEIVFLSFWSL